MPTPEHIKPKPPRAQPLQPDKIGPQDKAEPRQDESDRDAQAKEEFDRSAHQQAEQSETAGKNVREGYD
jgi:hypothetical protein